MKLKEDLGYVQALARTTLQGAAFYYDLDEDSESSVTFIVGANRTQVELIVRGKEEGVKMADTCAEGSFYQTTTELMEEFLNRREKDLRMLRKLVNKIKGCSYDEIGSY